MAEFDPNESKNASAPDGSSPSVSTAPEGKKKHQKRTIFFITATVIALMLFAAAVMEPLVSVLRYILSLLSPLIIGGIIGGFVLAWRLIVAAWYVPLTVYRLIVG